MKHALTLAAALLCLLPATLPADEIFVVNSASRTLSRIDTAAGTVNNSFAQLGLTPNLMDMDGDYIYIACSGDNAVQVIDRVSGAHIRYIPVAPSSNPYDVLKAGDYLYVTGLFTNKVYKISLLSNSVVGALDVGTSPEGLCSDGQHLYVCNTGGYANNYANSSVSVIELDSFTLEDTVPVASNPQYIVIHGNQLNVSCTGNWADVSGKVDILDLDTLELVQRLDIGGHPGSLWISDAGMAYLGEGMGTALYSYNADTYEIYHGAAAPLDYPATLVSGNSSLIALLQQNWSSNSLVYLYNLDFSPLGIYTVRLSSSDIIVAQSNSSAAEDTVEPVEPRLWPNPLRKGESLNISTGRQEDLELSIYNLRGQLLAKQRVVQGKACFTPDGLASGVYLYRIGRDGSQSTGKLMILD
jgi:hypothetical protein